MSIINGKQIAGGIRAELGPRAKEFEQKRGRKCTLAVVLVGNNPASEIYVANKGKLAEELGFGFGLYRFDEKAPEEGIVSLINDLNADTKVDGILVQMPLPAQINPMRVMEAIDPRKDVDGFTPTNTGNMVLGYPAVVPATPRGCLELVLSVCPKLTGLHAVVVGRSNIVGKPMAQLLLQHDCTVTICHSKTVDLATHTRMADILVVAIGKPNFITADMVKPNAIVIDVGINRTTTLLGDVDFDSVSRVVAHISPVPGGVGPMTMAMLFNNLLAIAQWNK